MSKMFTCCCGGDVAMKSAKGLTWRVTADIEVRVPEHVEVPRCSRCGESWQAPVDSKRSSEEREELMRALTGVVMFALALAQTSCWGCAEGYSDGERAGVVWKFSRKGWFLKSWEGELNMVVLPGALPEKFFFTTWDDAVAAAINRNVGRRVALRYEEKVGLPGRCFGDTRFYVTKVSPFPDAGEAPSAPR